MGEGHGGGPWGRAMGEGGSHDIIIGPKPIARVSAKSL